MLGCWCTLYDWQLAALRAEVDKLRSKIISQRDASDERVAKLVAETRETNQRSVQERQSFQNERLRLQQLIEAAKKNAEQHSERADVRALPEGHL